MIQLVALTSLLELKDAVRDMLLEHSTVGFCHAQVHPWYAVDAPLNCETPIACSAVTNPLEAVGVDHLIRQLFCATPEKTGSGLPDFESWPGSSLAAM